MILNFARAWCPRVDHPDNLAIHVLPRFAGYQIGYPYDITVQVDPGFQRQSRSTMGTASKDNAPSPIATHTDNISTSRQHSSVPPLAPLEYLQNQPRGSITDPSLHAAGGSNTRTSTANNNNSNNTSLLAPSYVFAANPTESSTPKMRKGRHSASNNKSRAVPGGKWASSAKMSNFQWE
jgi:hypothetical protein